MIRRPTWHWVFAAGMIAWVVTAAIQWWATPPLGHDEAQYALAALDRVAGRAQRWFYLSPGMNAIAVPGVLLDAGERGLRLLPLVIGIAFVLSIAALARRAVGGAAAAWAIAVLAGCRSLIQRSTDLLSDIPSCTCLLLAMLVIVTELGRDTGPRWRVVIVGPLLAAALYVRYASCVPITFIVVFAAALWWRSIARRPLPVIATALAFIALCLPHAFAARHATGSIFGILFASNTVIGGSHGDAFMSYVAPPDPFKFYGLLAPFLMVAGLVSIVRIRDRRALFLWLVALANFVGMGMLAVAQPRYVFLSTTLWIVLGTNLLVTIAMKRTPNVQRVLAACAVVAIAYSWVKVVRQARRYPSGVRANNAGTFVASTAVQHDAAGRACRIMGRHLTQLEWYSGCTGELEPPLERIGRGEPVYVVWDNTGGGQPDFAAMPGRHRHVIISPMVHVIRLEPDR